MTRRTRNSSLLVWLAVLVGITSLPFASSPSQVALAAPPISAPNTLSANLVLGQSTQQALTLTNTSSTQQQIRLFEAFEPSSMANARAALPEELRSVQLPDEPWRVDPDLEADLAADRSRRRDFLVFLADQADLSGAYGNQSWRDRGSQVYRLLQSHATSAQAAIRRLLDQRGVSYRAFWIVNALEVHGNYDDLQALAARPEVGLIQAVQQISVDALEASPLSLSAVQSQCDLQPDALNNSSCWHVRKTGVDRIWKDFGVTGAGITVANIDTGVDVMHPALIRQYRGFRGEKGLEHAYNWFDPQGQYIAPGDINGHGTHTMGVMVGRGDGTADQPAVGVAPDASWIAAQGCENTTCSTSDLIASAQWILAPTDQYGQNPRPDLRPHIVNNSWTGGGGGDDWYSGYTAAWRAAGIFPIFAAGNKNGGAECESISSPGDYPDVLAVGATDSTDTIASFSKRGPTKDGRLKPDLSAPGVNIVSTYIHSDRYASLQGTSMAAPHVAGLVALLWSANPSLIGDYDATYAILTSTAKRIDDARCGDTPGQPNNLYGYGRVQAYEALAQAKVDVPWLQLASSQTTIEGNESKGIAVSFDASKVPAPGVYTARILVHGQDLSEDPLIVNVTMTVAPAPSQAQITGKVVDAVQGHPLLAEVAVVGGARVKVDETGSYTITLPLRETPYELVASALSYISQTKSVLLNSPLGATQNFSLTTDLPKIMVDTAPMSTTISITEVGRLVRSIHNVGTKPLSYTAEIVIGSYGVWPSSDPGLASDLQEPPNATKLALGDDSSSGPIDMGFAINLFNHSYRNVYINANGMLAFENAPTAIGYRASCVGISQTTGAALLPFYADLDPSQGGTVSYATTSEGFVVTYKDVPLHSSNPENIETAERYSFQVVIKRNGDFQYRYGALGVLPRALTIGVQENSFQAQIISCNPNGELVPGLIYDLRRQPSTELWAGLLGSSAVVQPGESAQFQINLLWIRPNAYQQPLRGTVLIRSNDLFRPEVQIPFLLTTQQAPYELYYPLITKR